MRPHSSSDIAALFDLDGVLLDSETVYTEIWDAIDRRFPTGIGNFALKIKGTTLPNILNSYFPDHGIQMQVVEMLKEEEERMEYVLFDGVVEFLEELREHDIPAAIVTSSNHKKMERLFNGLPGFRDYFGAVITDADVKCSKPSPEGYLLAAERLGFTPGRHCFVFEDSLAGLQAGNSAGATVIGLATTNPREMLKGRAHLVIDRIEGFSVQNMYSCLEQAVL